MYGTDRQPTDAASPEEFYGNELGDLTLGSAIVTVPQRRVKQGPSPGASCFDLGGGAIQEFSLTRLKPLDEAAPLPAAATGRSSV